MRYTCRAVTAAMLLALPSLAGFDVPKRVYRVAQLDAAKAEAEQKKKPLTFVMSDTGTSCPLCEHATEAAMKELKLKTVVVYAQSGEDWDTLPDVVRSALRSAEAGRFIPKTVIVDSALQNVIAIVPYARGREYDKLLRDARKAAFKATSAARRR